MESKYSKYILIVLTALCVLLIGITSLRDGVMDPLRTGVGYFLIPIQSGVNKVGTGIYNELTDFTKLKGALAENEKLKDEIARLTEDNSRLQAERSELERLRSLYQLDQDYMQYDKIGARVIARDSEKWFQVFRINKGSADGVRVDMNVMADGGLVGIVTDEMCIRDRLLSVIIRTGSREESSLELAERILDLGGPGDGLVGLLHHSLPDLMKVKGIGMVKGVQLACVAELSRRIWKRKTLACRTLFTCPGEIADYYMEDMRHLEKEEIRAMFLDVYKRQLLPASGQLLWRQLRSDRLRLRLSA